MEGKEDHPRSLADQLRGDQTAGWPSSRRVRRSRRHGVPLVRAGTSERVQAERERLHDVDDGTEVQDRIQAGRQREMERYASDAAEADYLVPAQRDRGSRERAGGGRGRSRTTRGRTADASSRTASATGVG